MMELIAMELAPIMFVSLIFFLLMGYPAAFALAANGLVFFAIGVWLAPYSEGTITLDWPLLYTMPQRLWGVLSNETLLAIPFFTFMGLILERSGMAEDLLDTVGQLFGPIRGGVAFAVVLVGGLLAATTGVVAASVISMGLISLPVMLRYGYDRKLATGVIAASGTLAQIIPPSLVLIVLADQLGRSVGDMYRGALVPGLILMGMYMGYVAAVAIFRPVSVPALPLEARTLGSGVTSLLVAIAAASAVGYASHFLLYETQGANADILGATLGVGLVYAYALADRYLKLNTLSYLAQQVIMVLIPPLALIFLVLGTIFLGIATPTEGGAMGAVGALALAAAKGRLRMPMMQSALVATTRLSSFVMFILIGARVFSLTFYGVNGHVWVESLLTAVPGGQLGFLMVVNAIIFVLGFFIDFFEIAFIIVPLLIAPANALGVDLIWLGVIIGVNLQTSFLTPPFGFALFYLRSVASRVPYLDKVTGRRIEPIRTADIYRGAVAFIGVQVLMIVLVIGFPGLVQRYEAPVVDPNTVRIDVPAPSTLGAPQFGAPAAPARPPRPASAARRWASRASGPRPRLPDGTQTKAPGRARAPRGSGLDARRPRGRRRSPCPS
jgi:TRAP-type mannitol/chloroaromatic compound transport system permease large subunit